MEKDIINIHLSKRLAMCDGNSEHNFDSLCFNDWVECLRKVKIETLVKAFGDELGLVARNETIRITFYPKDLLVANDVVVGLVRN